METIQPVHVLSVDADSMGEEPKIKKMILAMQASAQAGTTEFDDANAQLIEHALAHQLPPGLTYEDLIFTNPIEAGQPFVMSGDIEVQQNEALFYSTHRHIEEQLAAGVAGLQCGEYTQAVHDIDSANTMFRHLHRELDREAFALMRPFFGGLNGYPGPSGLYTAVVPTLDLLVHGGANIAPDEQVRMLEDIDRGLYPSHQSDELGELLQSDDAMIVRDAGVQDDITSMLNQFRSIHTGNVRKFIPQAFDAGAAGTGGVADIRSYLASKYITIEEEYNDRYTR